MRAALLAAAAAPPVAAQVPPCAGGSLQACIGLCPKPPAASAGQFKACVNVCKTNCTGGPDDAFDAGCANQTDCEACTATRVAGPVTGKHQMCGWCFGSGTCHDTKTLEKLKCELKCTAKRLPAFDGPVCPYSTCDPKKYTCDKAAGKCEVTGDQHNGTGTSFAICEAECAIAPAPAPPTALYQCASGQCAESQTGIDLDACQVMCHPQPVPPTPPATLYQCESGACAVSPTGIGLDTCQAMCHPQPPAPPATVYQCTNSKCTESATGIDLKTCQDVCH